MAIDKKNFMKHIIEELCHSLRDASESSGKVDQMINKVTEAGGKESREPQDYGWMYGRGFQDIDGHFGK
jgi:predicted lactoylglutathione lyase